MPRQKIQNQTFNDGIANIYSVENIAPSGHMPKDGLTKKESNIRVELDHTGIILFLEGKLHLKFPYFCDTVQCVFVCKPKILRLRYECNFIFPCISLNNSVQLFSPKSCFHSID